MPDDYTSDIQTTGTVAVGGSATGEIETAEDRDWFAVTLVADRTYRIDLEGQWTAGRGTLRDPFLRGIHDENGTIIAGTTDDDEGTGLNSEVTFTAPADGTYYVAAGAWRDRTGTYTLSVTDVTAEITDDYTSDIQTTGTVAVGGSARGAIGTSDDVDWFAVTLEADTTYRIDLEGLWTAGRGTLRDPFLRGIHDNNGDLIPRTSNDDGGTGLNSQVTFTAPADGTYYVAAGAWGDRTGTYTLSVTEITPSTPDDDYAAGTGTSGTVAVGVSTTGEIETARDVDWFAVTLEADRTYRIDLEGSATDGGTLGDPYLRGIHDENGVFIAGTTDDDEGTGFNSQVTFTAEADGTYYVAAGAWGLYTGTYLLAVTDVTDGIPDDFAAGTGTSGAVAVGGSTTGDINTPGDRDWFAVTLEAGTTYRIDLEGEASGSGTLRSPYLRGVHDANGDLIPGTTDYVVGTGFDSQVTFTADAGGTYYVAAGAWGRGTGTYALSVTEITDDFAAGTGTSGTVAVGASATGEIETSYDVDWFAVTLEVGKTYRIDLEGAATGAGTLSDPYLRGVHDYNGSLIAGTTNNDGGIGRNSRVTFTPEAGGTYYVAAGARWEHYQTGTYTLSVTEVVDDFVAGTGTSGTAAVGGSARGEIETAGDVDWFAVTLEEGRAYRIDLKGFSTRGGTLLDPYLRGIHDADGIFIAGTTNNDGGWGLNSQVTFTAIEGGTYYVAAGAWEGGTGTYTLSVTEVPDDYAAGIGTTGTVIVGGSAPGETEAAGDVDWFAVTLEAGSTYRVDLKGFSTRDGTLLDPYLHGVHDAEGVLIDGTTNDDGDINRNSQVTFTPEAGGTYYVAAGAFGGRTGTYTLSVTELVDDFAAGTETSGTVAVGGSAPGETETAGDVDWFAVTLEAGSTYRVDLKGFSTRDGTLLDPYLHGVHDAEGVLIAGTTDNDGGAGRNSRVTFTADVDGTHYVAAGSWEDRTGTYSLSVTDVTVAIAEDDFASGTGTTGTVAVGGSARGEIGYVGDRDWFAVTVEADRTYRIDLEGSTTGGGTLHYPFLRGIHDADGVLIAGTTDNDGGAGYNSRLTFTADEGGTFYVAAGATLEAKGTYTLSVTEVVDDFAAGTGTSGTVAVGASATGEIETADDRDWFAVTLEEDRTYRIDLKGSWTRDGTLENPYLRGVHDANGVLIAGTTDNHGGAVLNSRVTFTPDESGTYYVAAGGYLDNTGTYTLSVADITDDYPAGTGTSGTAAVGGSATGEIETAHDRDWFAVTLEADRTYRIDLEGEPTGGTLSDPFLRGIHDEDGIFIAGTTNDDGGSGLNSQVTFTAIEGGTYYVAAGAWGGRTGTYTLSVTEVPDDFAAGTGTTGTVIVGGSAVGGIDFAGDRDWFAVTLEADTTYRIDLEGDATGAGTLADPYLRGVHDANGAFIAGTTNDGGGAGLNSRVTFTADEDGTYYVVAGANLEGEGTYTLSVEEVI